MADAHHRLALVWADRGCTGSLVEHCLAAFALVLAIVKRSDGMCGFVVLPKRWIVKRLFAHLMCTLRLARDYERRTTSPEAMIYWSMALLMTRRPAWPHPGRSKLRATRRSRLCSVTEAEEQDEGRGHALEAGESVVTLARWLGHSSPAITLGYYAHFMPEAGSKGRGIIDGLLGERGDRLVGRNSPDSPQRR